MAIYFIQAPTGEVKIGMSDNPEARLRSLQTGWPQPLKLLHVIEGDRRIEQTLHMQFAKLRVRREWFRFEGELREFVQSKSQAVAARPRKPMPAGVDMKEYWRAQIAHRRLAYPEEYLSIPRPTTNLIEMCADANCRACYFNVGHNLGEVAA